MDDAVGTPSKRRQQQRARDTRKALLDTAVNAFSTRGYDGVSVRQIEELAGVKRGLVAYHFGDKNQLWRVAVGQLFAALNEDFMGRAATLADVAPAEAARAMVRAFVRYSASFPALNRLMMLECTSDSWRVACIVDEHIGPMLDALYRAVPAASVLLWGDRDPHRYYLLIGAGAFVFNAEQECLRLFATDPRQQAFVERHADIVADMLIGP